MSKTLSKILAVVLSVCMLFAVPVMAAAEDEVATFAVNASVYSVSGNWDTDYAEMVTIKVRGGVKDINEGAVVTVGVGDSLSNIRTVTIETLACVFEADSGVIYVSVPLVNYINHAETYHFYFEEGAFVNADGAVSEEITVDISGNDIIETLEVEHISVKPIEKLIDWMYTWGAEGAMLDIINFIVSILEWFLYI